MRLPIWLTFIAAVVTTALVIVIGTTLIQPDRPLIVRAAFTLTEISPNADGVNDVTQFNYEISERAIVSLTFTDPDGRVYVFRDAENRAGDEYSVLFSGVVDGYTLPDETIAGNVVRRLLPDGTYTWRLQATAQDDGEIAEESGTLIINESDSALPQLTEFTVSPQVFTPNQDGVADRVMINVFVSKEADLTVYLEGENGARIPVARREEGRDVGEAGRHVYDYEGGVDINADPPPDGTYTVIALARDAEGQEIQQETQLTIRDGGKPRAEIVAQPVGATVVFDVIPYDARYFTGDPIPLPDTPDSSNMLPVNVPVGDILVFKLTIENYGPAPIRTSGPPPGTVYEQSQRPASFDEYEQSGVWRVGLQCETSEESYPWRWAIGTVDDLYSEVDPITGNVFWYLPPGGRAVVWGGVRMTDLIRTANPQACWAGLIHEDVSIVNSNVGRREVQLADTGTSVDNE